MGWTSADLLARCYREAKRPTTDSSTSDAEWYDRLSEAQDRWTAIFAVHCPHVLIGDPEQLTTSDNKVYTMSAFPLGGVEIRHGRNGPVLLPGPEFGDATDFVVEGQNVRMAHNQERTFTDGLWARYVPTGTVIDAGTEPTLKPEWARELLVLQAVANWSEEGGLRDPSPFLRRLQHRAWGDPNTPGDVGIVGALKLQFFGQGTVTADQGAYWWRQWSRPT